MKQFSLSNVVNISVSQTPSGLGAYNTSNLAIFTPEAPDPVFSSGFKIYREPFEVAEDFGTSSTTYKMALAAFSQQPNFLLPGGYLVVLPLQSSETLAAAITRTRSLVEYFGVMAAQIEIEADMLAAAAVIQADRKLGFFVQRTTPDLAPGGSLDKLRTGSFDQSRGLIRIDTATEALRFQAAYAARALSTVFSGSLTTQNMHLKKLNTIEPDPALTQTDLEAAKLAGADAYVSFQGDARVFSSGANGYFDQVYNRIAYGGDAQIAGFNFIANSNTKVPQTEDAMTNFKGAYRLVCEKYVRNGYVAPGEWNSPTTFGNQEDLISNIRQFGYYIYSDPIALQLQSDREDRVAPLIQIAMKEAGAINSGSVIVYVNP